jgi:hypothetical protein
MRSKGSGARSSLGSLRLIGRICYQPAMRLIQGFCRPAASVLVIAAVALGAAGCGGSSSSSKERAQLLDRISGQLNSSLTAPDLSNCVLAQLRKQSNTQLRQVANAGQNPDPATRRLVFGFAAGCVAQGNGSDAIHGAIVSSFQARASSSIPPVLSDCVLEKVKGIPDSELASVVRQAEVSQAAEEQSGRQLGIGLAHQCLQQPQVLSALRQRFVTQVKVGLRSRSLSSAFQNCVVAKAQQVSASEIEQIALDPSTAGARGQALGQAWAKACVASGVRP